MKISSQKYWAQEVIEDVWNFCLRDIQKLKKHFLKTLPIFHLEAIWKNYSKLNFFIQKRKQKINFFIDSLQTSTLLILYINQQLSMTAQVKSVVLYDTERDKQSKESFAQEVLEGLKEPVKRIPMKFVYDEAGSKLFTAILQAPAYYLFKCDKQIIETKGSEILKAIGKQKFNLIDLGAGDGLKTEILLDIAVKEGYDTHYIPLDISLDSNIELGKKMNEKFPEVQITTITSEFNQGIDWVQKYCPQKNVFFFLGGTIGNQSLEGSEKFAEMMNQKLKPGEMIFVTIDLWKDPQVIARAYFDNPSSHQLILNSLVRLNKQLECNFNLEKFYGYHYLDPFTKYIEGVIISKETQIVKISNENIQFKKGEVIKCMLSRKWLEEKVIEIFQKRGFKKVGVFKDSKEYLAIMGFEKK